MHSLIAQRSGLPEAWYKMLSAPDKSPDSDVIVRKVTPIVDKSTLTFEYGYRRSADMLIYGGSGELPTAGDFYVGTQPTIKKAIVIAGGQGSKLIIEWLIRFQCAVYRAETRTLYVCAREPESADASQR